MVHIRRHWSLIITLYASVVKIPSFWSLVDIKTLLTLTKNNSFYIGLVLPCVLLAPVCPVCPSDWDPLPDKMGCLALSPAAINNQTAALAVVPLLFLVRVHSAMPSGGGDEMGMPNVEFTTALKSWLSRQHYCNMLKLNPKASRSALRKRKCNCTAPYVPSSVCSFWPSLMTVWKES